MEERYSTPAIVFHWLIAILIIANFSLGLVLEDLPRFSPVKLKYVSWHKWAGVTVLALAALRLLWRLKRGAPDFESTMPPWQRRAAQGVHYVLYVLMFGVPLSGYFYSLAAGYPVVWFGLIELPVLIGRNPELASVLKELHEVLAMTLAVAVGVHVAAALKHHFIDHDGVLKRMLP